MKKPLIIAHRGASGLAHENTREAFQKAIDLKVDYIEFDVRKTKDNVLVCFHDAKLQKKRISNLTYEELQAQAGREGFSVPQVEDAFNKIKGKTKVIVELKKMGYEKELVELILKYLAPSDFIIASFYGRVLRVVKKCSPDIQTGLVIRKVVLKESKLVLTRFRPISSAKKYRADFLLVNYLLYNKRIAARAGKYGMPVFVWTVNDELGLKKFMTDSKLAGVITDRPDLAMSLRGK